MPVCGQWLLQCCAVSLLVLAPGCGGGETLGEILPASDASPIDSIFDAARPDAASPHDAGAVDATPGDASRLGPFGPPTLVAPLSSPAYDEDPTLTGDLLELYFMSSRSGNGDIWLSRRTTPDESWTAPVMVAELSSTDNEQTPSISLDGLMIWFSSNRPANHGGSNIWFSQRPDRQSAWSEPIEVEELNTDASEVGPATDETNLIMVIGSNRQGGTRADMYFSTRPDTNSTWSTPVLAENINTSSDDWDAFLGGGGLQLFFMSDRAGMAGDLFWATRSSVDGPFYSIVPLEELNTPAHETDPALSKDLRLILFGSNVSGNAEIYQAVR